MNKILPSLARHITSRSRDDPPKRLHTATRLSPEDARCPSCGAHILMPMDGKRRCPVCAEALVVRSAPDSGEAILATKAQAAEMDRAQAMILADHKLDLALGTCGVSDAERSEIETALARRFGRQPDAAELLWEASQVKLRWAARAGDFAAMSRIYFVQACQLSEERQDPFRLLKESAKCQIWHHRKAGTVKAVAIKTCDAPRFAVCRRLRGVQLKADAALEQLPLPVRGCVFGLRDPGASAETFALRCRYLAGMEILK